MANHNIGSNLSNEISTLLVPLTSDIIRKTTAECEVKNLFEMGFDTKVGNFIRINQKPKTIYLYHEVIRWFTELVFTDLVIKVGICEYCCHRIVFDIHTDFFYDKRFAQCLEVPESNVTAGAFSELYTWMITDDIQISHNGIMQLFKAAQYFRVDELVNQCWELFETEDIFNEDTAFILFCEARMHKYVALEKMMLSRVGKFYLPLVATKDFVLLDVDKLIFLLSSNYIMVNVEYEIFLSVIRWLNADWPERKRHIVQLMNCVRFGEMGYSFILYLKNTVKCRYIKRVIEPPEIVDMIQCGLEFIITKKTCNPANLQATAEKYNLKMSVPRTWIFDKNCSFHHRAECNKKDYFSLETFEKYLGYIQRGGIDYWRTFIYADEDEAKCCSDKLNNNDAISTAETTLTSTTSDSSVASTTDASSEANECNETDESSSTDDVFHIHSVDTHKVTWYNEY